MDEKEREEIKRIGTETAEKLRKEYRNYPDSDVDTIFYFIWRFFDEFVDAWGGNRNAPRPRQSRDSG